MVESGLRRGTILGVLVLASWAGGGRTAWPALPRACMEVSVSSDEMTCGAAVSR